MKDTHYKYDKALWRKNVWDFVVVVVKSTNKTVHWEKSDLELHLKGKILHLFWTWNLEVSCVTVMFFRGDIICRI